MRLLRAYLILWYPLLFLAPLAHAQQRHQDTLLMHFAVDKYDIRPMDAAKTARTFHDSAIGFVKIDSVVITGYTDKTGTLAHNQRLSVQRANSAGEWLRAQLGGGLSSQTQLGGRLPPSDRHLPSPGHPGDSLTWLLLPGGIAPTPELSDSANRRAEIVIHYHFTTPPSAAPPPMDTAVAMTHDSTQPSAVISLPINFIADTPTPTDTTRKILPGYIDKLRQYADRRMEIDGFVNSLGPLSGANDPLFKLSVNRAKFIYDYMVEAGFDPAKLTYKGMGNASPVNPDPITKQQMDANMRVEIKVF